MSYDKIHKISTFFRDQLKFFTKFKYFNGISIPTLNQKPPFDKIRGHHLGKSALISHELFIVKVPCFIAVLKTPF